MVSVAVPPALVVALVVPFAFAAVPVVLAVLPVVLAVLPVAHAVLPVLAVLPVAVAVVLVAFAVVLVAVAVVLVVVPACAPVLGLAVSLGVAALVAFPSWLPACASLCLGALLLRGIAHLTHAQRQIKFAKILQIFVEKVVSLLRGCLRP